MEENSQEPIEESVVDLSTINAQIIEDSPEKSRENTRSEIAKFYVWAFFATIGVTFLIGACNYYKAQEYRDMLVTVSGILSGPLGFIIGYYFKTASIKD